MEPEKLNNYNNFQNFIKLQKEIIFSYSNVSKFVLELEELFRFFNENFNEFHHKENFAIILAFVHRCFKVLISHGNYLEDDIGILLVNLLLEHGNDENDINIVVQIAYQIMSSIKYFECNDALISEKFLRELIATIPKIKRRSSASNCIACLKKYVELFPKSNKNLEQLWSYLKNQLEINLNNGLTKDVEIDILVQLIDDFKMFQSNFHDDPALVNTIQILLKSAQKKDRKYGYYLLKKLIDYVMENVNTVAKLWMSPEHIHQIKRSWMLYAIMLESLEESQSHLILPSLKNLEELIIKKRLPSPWLNILYIRILTHSNSLVLRWSVEFFLNTFSSSDLCDEVLRHLLQATNSNLLFNYEGYFLKEEYISSFLKGDVKYFLKTFSKVKNWKPVPLYMWLENLKETQLPASLTFEEILKISSCIRKLQNCNIREKAIQMFEKLFKNYTQKMSMKEYVTYIETLYNSGDKFSEHATFFSKKSSITKSETEDSIFKQRFYEIFTNTNCKNNDLLLFLSDLPVEQHGWLKFAPFQLALEEHDRNLIKNIYKLDLNSLPSSDINDIINAFKNILLGSQLYDKHEITECCQAAISFYIHQRTSFELEKEDTLRYILNNGIKHSNVLYTFANKLLHQNEEKIDLWFIDELLKYNHEKKTFYDNISRYLCRVYSDDENIIKKYVIFIWGTTSFDTKLLKNTDNRKMVTDEFFNVLASQGDKRTEEAFCFYHFEPKYTYMKPITKNDKEFVLNILKYHTDITKKKPRYFENSNEHRAKLRIASCVYVSMFRNSNTTRLSGNESNIEVLDHIWDILLNENNQLNIIYIHEFNLGVFEFRDELILSKLKEAQNMTPSQQISVISVGYIYLNRRTVNQKLRNELLYSLLSLTMGANFQTRTFAQMSLYKLLKTKFEQIEEFKPLIKSIEHAAGTKLPEYLNDFRLHMYVLSKIFDILPLIYYVTNVPFDELLLFNVDFSIFTESKSKCDKLNQIESFRKKYLNKFNVTKKEDTLPNDQIQRKMNPVNNLTEPHNLMVYPSGENLAEMFVVASLIQKLANLGGIARTCEVLGIKNLVMDSKMHIEKDDFKNLSMTAEKTLNILEIKQKDLKDFLMKKKLEGYTIIGAEQTCNSESFDNFQFPQKCVLLLGHEKDGIPAPLLGLLHTAVEIPQFGQVRSLNVHVTGALFMWEYCKQQLIQKK